MVLRNSNHIIILGAGPCGLGAAWQFEKEAYHNWILLEAGKAAGGLAASYRDDQGFVWDLGGHVVFSHYDYFDQLLDVLLGDQWVEHQRESWVWMRDRFIPYPMQYNIWHLPPEDLQRCLEGLLDVYPSDRQPGKAINFGDWIGRTFGAGLSDIFMIPYNFKVWAYDPHKMSAGWMGDRVPIVDLKRVIGNLVYRREDISWGPNACFRFPLYGGTGQIWRTLASQLPANQLHFNTPVVRIHASSHQVETMDGKLWHYDKLISTIPMDNLLRSLTDQPLLTTMADRLVYSSTHVVGLGFAGSVPENLSTKCWIYFPEPDVPFYRVTVFSNYSPNNVPQPGSQYSLMAEISESPEKRVDQDNLIKDVLSGLYRCKLANPKNRVVSRWHCRLEHGYPTPFLGRDEIIVPLDTALKELDIYSRGRFGGWKYEVSNQDHSVMQGVEVVNHFLHGDRELTYYEPATVNSR